MVWLAYIPVILYFLLETIRKKPLEEQRKNRSSTITLAVAQGFMILLPTMIFFYKPMNNHHSHPLFFIGMAFGVVGVLIRATAMQTLGRFFSRNIGIQKQHQLVVTGCYRYIRHPGYLGTLGTFLGFALSTASWLAIVVNILCFFIAYSYRIRVEEDALTACFGSAYLNYKLRTWKLIPFLY